jgi:hypothetical protein
MINLLNVKMQLPALLVLMNVCLNPVQSIQAQSEPKLGCQATVNKVLQEIRSKGVRRVHWSISKGTANSYRTGNPTNRTDVLNITFDSYNETYTNTDPKSDSIIDNIVNSPALMKSWTDKIVANCGNTAIVSFGIAQSDFSDSYYIQSDGTTKLMECPDGTPPSILPWGKEWGPQCS